MDDRWTDCHGDPFGGMGMRRLILLVSLVSVFIACVALANWLTARYHFIPIGFGLVATAGTIAAGACLALRDGLQDIGGRLAVIVAILAGAAVSFMTSNPALAIASGAAFLVSECADAAVYTPLRRRAKTGDTRWVAAVMASGLVGTIVDTIVFLGLAFGMAAIAPALVGQLIGKSYPTLVYVLTGRAHRALYGESFDRAHS